VPIEHAFPRADKAAREVDPMLLATALDHIARSAARSRSMTRRLRWIERRAVIALEGREYRDLDVDLPKDPGPATNEKNARRIAYLLSVMHRIRALAPSDDVLALVDEAIGQSRTHSWVTALGEPQDD